MAVTKSKTIYSVGVAPLMVSSSFFLRHSLSYFPARSVFHPIPLLALLKPATRHNGPNINRQLPISTWATLSPTIRTIRYGRHHRRARSRWRRLRPSSTRVSPGFEKSMWQTWNNVDCRWGTIWVWEDWIIFRDWREWSETWYIGDSEGGGLLLVSFLSCH